MYSFAKQLAGMENVRFERDDAFCACSKYSILSRQNLSIWQSKACVGWAVVCVYVSLCKSYEKIVCAF